MAVCSLLYQRHMIKFRSNEITFLGGNILDLRWRCFESHQMLDTEMKKSTSHTQEALFRALSEDVNDGNLKVCREILTALLLGKNWAEFSNSVCKLSDRHFDEKRLLRKRFPCRTLHSRKFFVWKSELVNTVFFHSFIVR